MLPRPIRLLDLARELLKNKGALQGNVVSITSEAEGAIRNGTRVIKVVFESGDYHPVGAQATVRGSVGPSDDGEFGYFVQWDDLPSNHVFVRGRKLKAL